MPKIVVPSDEDIRRKWEPYITALGRVVNSWNHLQEALGYLFVVLTGLNNTNGFAIWYSTPDDRTQRRTLGAVIETLAPPPISPMNFDEEPDGFSKNYPSALDDLRWLMEKANQLADKRNDAVHAPCGLMQGDEVEFKVRPLRFYGHPRAKNLLKKEIVKEFEWYVLQADTLATYARKLATALSSKTGTWPERPVMPTLGQRSNRRGGLSPTVRQLDMW